MAYKLYWRSENSFDEFLTDVVDKAEAEKIAFDHAFDMWKDNLLSYGVLHGDDGVVSVDQEVKDDDEIVYIAGAYQ